MSFSIIAYLYGILNQTVEFVSKIQNTNNNSLKRKFQSIILTIVRPLSSPLSIDSKVVFSSLRVISLNKLSK